MAGEPSREIEVGAMDAVELERFIGDFCISIHDMHGGALQNALLDLCDRLVAAEKNGDRMPDAF